MFRTLGSITRIVRRMIRPVTRLAFVALVWINRHTVLLWYRSLRAEVDEHGVDVGRLRQLVRGLWTVSNDHRVANSQQIQSIGLRPDGFEIEARADWPGRAEVEQLLAPVPPYPTTVTAA